MNSLDVGLHILGCFEALVTDVTDMRLAFFLLLRLLVTRPHSVVLGHVVLESLNTMTHNATLGAQ